MPLKLYVSCALTEAPPEFRALVGELKKILKTEKTSNQEPVYEVLEFLGLTTGTPRDVYTHDIINSVGACNLVLAICDHPSTGLGWELCEVVKTRKVPVLGVVRQEKKLNRFLEGVAEYHDNFTIERYRDMLIDVPKLLDKFVEGVSEDMWDSVGYRGSRSHGGVHFTADD